MCAQNFLVCTRLMASVHSLEGTLYPSNSLLTPSVVLLMSVCYPFHTVLSVIVMVKYYNCFDNAKFIMYEFILRFLYEHFIKVIFNSFNRDQ